MLQVVAVDLPAFRASLGDDAPPDDVGLALQALWWEAKGDWDAGHELCNREGGYAGAWVHAYLHRVEGDLGNADYWYRRAGRSRPALAVEREWEEIARALLG